MKLKTFLATVPLLLLVPAAGAVTHTVEQEAGGAQTGSLSKEVKPGKEHCNGDVCVKNESTGSQDANVTPAKGDKDTATTVDTDTNFKGSVTGLDSNDTVNVGSSGTVTVTGTGGTVSAKGGSTVTVNNDAPAGGGGVITVALPGGAKIEVPAGAQGVIIKAP